MRRVGSQTRWKHAQVWRNVLDEWHRRFQVVSNIDARSSCGASRDKRKNNVSCPLELWGPRTPRFARRCVSRLVSWTSDGKRKPSSYPQSYAHAWGKHVIDDLCGDGPPQRRGQHNGHPPGFETSRSHTNEEMLLFQKRSALPVQVRHTENFVLQSTQFLTKTRGICHPCAIVPRWFCTHHAWVGEISATCPWLCSIFVAVRKLHEWHHGDSFLMT